MIMEDAASSAEIVLRKEELVRYMAWKSPETLKTYENYFKSIGHYAIQDRVHEHLENDRKNYMKEHASAPQLEKHPKRTVSHISVSDNPRTANEAKATPETEGLRGWEKLLALGGA